MTSITIPDFVFAMFEQKVTEINLIIVNKLCSKYNINKDDAKAFLQKELNINFNIIQEDIEQIKVIKKHKKKVDDDNHQFKATVCDARVFIATDLVVKQCSRTKIDGSNFCKLHQRLHEEDKLKYGTIYDDKPDCISTEKLKMKVKRNIY
jgi:hypothetical protein